MLEIRDLAKRHQLDRVVVRALEGVSMTVARGQFVALYGPSGSGKTTLLDLIVGLRSAPDSGSIRVAGRDGRRDVQQASRLRIACISSASSASRGYSSRERAPSERRPFVWLWTMHATPRRESRRCWCAWD